MVLVDYIGIFFLHAPIRLDTYRMWCSLCSILSLLCNVLYTKDRLFVTFFYFVRRFTAMEHITGENLSQVTGNIYHLML